MPAAHTQAGSIGRADGTHIPDLESYPAAASEAKEFWIISRP
jgi:hypothetical protein